MASSRDVVQAQPVEVSGPETITIIYASQGGTSQKLAQALAKACFKARIPKQVSRSAACSRSKCVTQVVNACDYDPDDLATETLVVFVVSTHQVLHPLDLPLLTLAVERAGRLLRNVKRSAPG